MPYSSEPSAKVGLPEQKCISATRDPYTLLYKTMLIGDIIFRSVP